MAKKSIFLQQAFAISVACRFVCLAYWNKSNARQVVTLRVMYWQRNRLRVNCPNAATAHAVVALQHLQLIILDSLGHEACSLACDSGQGNWYCDTSHVAVD